MDIADLLPFFPLLFWGLMLILLVYFTLEQLEKRSKEDFDDRDN